MRYDASMPRIAIAVSDLIFASRIQAAVRALGFEALDADTPAALRAALASAPEGTVVDLQDAAFDALDAVQQAAAAGSRVLAFGRHTEPGILRDARQAGATQAVSRSELVEELPALLQSLVEAGIGGV